MERKLWQSEKEKWTRESGKECAISSLIGRSLCGFVLHKVFYSFSNLCLISLSVCLSLALFLSLSLSLSHSHTHTRTLTHSLVDSLQPSWSKDVVPVASDIVGSLLFLRVSLSLLSLLLPFSLSLPPFPFSSPQLFCGIERRKALAEIKETTKNKERRDVLVALIFRSIFHIAFSLHVVMSSGGELGWVFICLLAVCVY